MSNRVGFEVCERVFSYWLLQQAGNSQDPSMLGASNSVDPSGARPFGAFSVGQSQVANNAFPFAGNHGGEVYLLSSTLSASCWEMLNVQARARPLDFGKINLSVDAVHFATGNLAGLDYNIQNALPARR
jgi:hypothetical protein